jgi:translation initiation factor IF-1
MGPHGAGSRDPSGFRGHLSCRQCTLIGLQQRRMIETSGVIEKEQGNGFYLVTLEQPAGHQCLCRAAGKLTKFRIKLLAGDKVLVEISPYDLSRGRITYRERNANAGPRPGGNRPGGPRRR